MAFNKAKLRSDFEDIFESMTDGNKELAKELADEINSFYTSGTISTDGQGNIDGSSGSGSIP